MSEQSFETFVSANPAYNPRIIVSAESLALQVVMRQIAADIIHVCRETHGDRTGASKVLSEFLPKLDGPDRSAAKTILYYNVLFLKSATEAVLSGDEALKVGLMDGGEFGRLLSAAFSEYDLLMRSREKTNLLGWIPIITRRLAEFIPQEVSSGR